MKRNVRLVCFAGLVGWANGVAAANWFLNNWVQQPMAFSLDVSRETYDLYTEGQAQEFQLLRAGGEFTELSFSMLQAGITIGYLIADQYDSELTAGQDLTGYDAGLQLKTAFPVFSGFRLGAYGDYRYAETSASVNGDEVRLTWQSWQTRAGGYWTLGRIGIGAGGGLGKLSGKQHNLDNQELRSATGIDKFAFVMMDLRVDDGGHVGTELVFGERGALQVYFQRFY